MAGNMHVFCGGRNIIVFAEFTMVSQVAFCYNSYPYMCDALRVWSVDLETC